MQAIYSTPEIAILVFQQCGSFRDAIALASTCKFFGSIWRLHFSTIIWPLAQTEIPGFSQALMAVSPSGRQMPGERYRPVLTSEIT